MTTEHKPHRKHDPSPGRNAEPQEHLPPPQPGGIRPVPSQHSISPDEALDSLKRYDVNAWLVVGDELARLRRLEEQFDALHRLAQDVRDGWLLWDADTAHIDAACVDLDEWLTAYDGRSDGAEVTTRGDGRSQSDPSSGDRPAVGADAVLDRPADSTVTAPVSLAEPLDVCPRCGRDGVLDPAGAYWCSHAGGCGHVWWPTSNPASEPEAQ